MGYYSALKRKEILSQSTTWMNLEDIMLSEISQSQKRQTLYDSTYMRWKLNWSNSQKQEVEWWLSGAGRQGKREVIV